MLKMVIKTLHPDARRPSQATTGSAGYDLSSIQEGHIRPGEWSSIRTGIAMEIPPGCVGLVCPRSGIAVKHGVTILNTPGIIDSDYRGEIRVPMVNHSTETFFYKIGDRIAQLVVCPTTPLQLVFLDTDEELSDSDRGAGGFGSTGR